jgi:hypothetical protein
MGCSEDGESSETSLLSSIYSEKNKGSRLWELWYAIDAYHH